MPSMSYCMFENTSLEMDQLLEAMEQASNLTELDLNEYETRAFERLAHQCRAFLQNAEELFQAEAALDELLDISG